MQPGAHGITWIPLKDHLVLGGHKYWNGIFTGESCDSEYMVKMAMGQPDCLRGQAMSGDESLQDSGRGFIIASRINEHAFAPLLIPKEIAVLPERIEAKRLDIDPAVGTHKPQ